MRRFMIDLKLRASDRQCKLWGNNMQQTGCMRNPKSSIKSLIHHAAIAKIEMNVIGAASPQRAKQQSDRPGSASLLYFLALSPTPANIAGGMTLATNGVPCAISPGELLAFQRRQALHRLVDWEPQDLQFRQILGFPLIDARVVADDDFMMWFGGEASMVDGEEGEACKAWFDAAG